MPTKKDANASTIQTLSELPVTGPRSKRIPLPVNYPFRLWVDPLRVRFVDHRPRYNPVAVAIIPGVQNVPGSGDPTNIDAAQVKLGRVPVPIRFPCRAWGEDVVGYIVPLDLGPDSHGEHATHYHDVWTRYDRIGSQMIRRFDQAGWDEFCSSVESLPGLGAVDPTVAEGERARIVAAAREHERMAAKAPGAAAHAAELLEAIKPPT
jgi:hypothetical protein